MNKPVSFRENTREEEPCCVGIYVAEVPLLGPKQYMVRAVTYPRRRRRRRTTIASESRTT